MHNDSLHVIKYLPVPISNRPNKFCFVNLFVYFFKFKDDQNFGFGKQKHSEMIFYANQTSPKSSLTRLNAVQSYAAGVGGPGAMGYIYNMLII